MAILNFTDVLKKVGINPNRTKLIRHVLTDKGFKACYDLDKVYEYTCHQKIGFGKGYDYWIVFISDGGTLCRLLSCYKVNGFVADGPEVRPIGLPEIEAKKYQGENAFYNLQYVDVLREYENRIIIDWGKSTRMWHQKGSTEKEIAAIRGVAFPGFERLCVSYDKLKTIIENQKGYESWFAAMSSVNAVYLIVDTKTGHQYVGSAYNAESLWGRWAVYVQTGGHGGNKKMVDIIKSNPNRCHDLQFSVLQVLSKDKSDDEIIRIENNWKDKLQTRKFGWNDN